MESDFKPSAELYPFRSRWIERQAGRVHYIDEGLGRPILFLHGNPTWSFLYRQIIARLSQRFRCVALDYPGFGLSDRPKDYGYTPREHAGVVESLISALDLRDLVVMGQDWGGPIGLAAAIATSQRVSGFVFGNTWFWPADRISVRLFSRVMSTRRMQRAILEKNFFVEKLIPLGTARSLPQQVMDHYRAAQPEPAARVGVAEFPRQILAAGSWLATLATEVPKTLGDRPLLLVWGMKDRVFPPKATLPRWRSAFRDWTLVALPQAKHFIQEDAPEAIADAIQQKFA